MYCVGAAAWTVHICMALPRLVDWPTQFCNSGPVPQSDVSVISILINIAVTIDM